jgi:hypothetical protein
MRDVQGKIICGVINIIKSLAEGAYYAKSNDMKQL